MSTTNVVDTARLNLLLNELRLPAIKVLWPQFAEQSDKEGWPAARFLATIAEHEIAERSRRRIERHLVEARLPTEAAAQLARRLRARLESPSMAQQRNSYDCGVFVVDGTRALVRRLAQGERPAHEPLHLDNLVANRRSLQIRLAHPGLG
ncbi:hypothetical protein ACVJH7_006685 [Bradyrhizobium elkanii]